MYLRDQIPEEIYIIEGNKVFTSSPQILWDIGANNLTDNGHVYNTDYLRLATNKYQKHTCPFISFS